MRTNRHPQDYQRRAKMTPDQERQENELLKRFGMWKETDEQEDDARAAIIPASEMHARIAEWTQEVEDMDNYYIAVGGQ